MTDLVTAVAPSPGAQRSILVRGVMVFGAIAVLAFILPLVYFAFLSALGLLGLGITAVLGVGIIKALPLLGQKWENKLLGLRKSEARTNPIEQIQNNVIRKAQQLKAFKDGMEVESSLHLKAEVTDDVALNL